MLKLADEGRKLTAFQIDNQYFEYRVVPFGVPGSPGWFQLSNMTAVNYARLCGIQLLLYLDDRLMIDQKDTLVVKYGVIHPQMAILALMLIILSGGFISLTKSELVPSKNLEFLGMTLDTEDATIEVPYAKWRKFTQLLMDALKGWESDNPDDWLRFKMLEKIRGKAVSYLLAMPKGRLFIRQMTRVITKTNETNWGANPSIPKDVRLAKEFKVWLELDIMLIKHIWRPEMLSLEKPSIVSFTDASSYAWGLVYYDDLGCQV